MQAFQSGDKSPKKMSKGLFKQVLKVARQTGKGANEVANSYGLELNSQQKKKAGVK